MSQPHLAQLGRVLWYEAVRVGARLALTLGWSLRLTGSRHVPDCGPVILVSNHESFFDPVLVGLATRRHLTYLARQTLFVGRFAGLIRSLNAVPIDNTGLGKDGLQQVLAELARGRAVLMFPEGERTHDGTLQPLKPGVALLIKRAKVPVVPVGIAGAFAAWPRQRKWPCLAPLWQAPSAGTLAVAVMPPLAGERLAQLPRQTMLAEVYQAIAAARRRASQLRRQLQPWRECCSLLASGPAGLLRLRSLPAQSPIDI